MVELMSLVVTLAINATALRPNESSAIHGAAGRELSTQDTPAEHDRFVSALIKALKEKEYSKRYEAGTELERLGPKAEPAVIALIEALGDNGGFVGSNSDFVCLKALRTL